MSKYYGSFICGHTGEVNIIGPVTDRERKRIRYFSKVCPECYKTQKYEKRKSEIEKALELAGEWEFPPLKGSEKQIAWANQIRIHTMQAFYEKCSICTSEQAIEYFYKQTHPDFWTLNTMEVVQKAQPDDLIQKMEDYLIGQTDSAWWIDHNKNNIFSFILPHSIANSIRQTEETIEHIYLADTIVSPNKVCHDGIVTILQQGAFMVAVYQADDIFSSLVQSCFMKWNKRWERPLTEITGSFQDRAGELGNLLLNHGFRISIQDETARMKAIDGTYEPECRHWIKKMKNQNVFHIVFPYDEEMAKLAMILPHARWLNHGVVVDLSHYEEVSDFADIFNFKFTKECQNMISQYSELLNNATCIIPSLKTYKEQINKLELILKESGTIISDLQDSD